MSLHVMEKVKHGYCLDKSTTMKMKLRVWGLVQTSAPLSQLRVTANYCSRPAFIFLNTAKLHSREAKARRAPKIPPTIYREKLPKRIEKQKQELQALW